MLRIRSGQTVSIDTVSHQGIINGMDPVKFFSAGGIAPGEVLPDALEIYHKAEHPKTAGAHVLTGPIYVESAEPGDMLEGASSISIPRSLRRQYRAARGSGVPPD